MNPAEQTMILVVEDDETVASSVVSALRDQRGMHVQRSANLAEAEESLWGSRPISAMILDLNLPDGSGLEFAQACRRRGSTIPILMLTARDAVADRVNGLQHGADDYLCKPFAMPELLARLDSLLRRATHGGARILRFGDIELDLLKRQVRRGPQDVTLSTRELDLLAFFMTAPEQVHEKSKILREVWSAEEAEDINLLQVYTNYLRNKLEQNGQPRVLHTVRGVGYVLSMQDHWT
jgi:two-component system response regulator MprA